MNSISEVVRHARAPMCFIIIWFIGNVLSVCNYSFYVRFEEELYGAQRINAHLAFTIIGGVSFLLWSAVHWTWAGKYAENMESRMDHLGYGMVSCFVLHDLPLFFVEYSMVLCCDGLHNGWQGLSFVYLWLLFMTSFVWTWSYYTWWAASWMQIAWGSSYDGATFMSPEELARRSQSPPGLPMAEAADAQRSRSPYAKSRSQPPTYRAAQVDPAQFMNREMRPPKVTAVIRPDGAPFAGSPVPQMHLVEERHVQPRPQHQHYDRAPFGTSPHVKPSPESRYHTEYSQGTTLQRGGSTVSGISSQHYSNGGHLSRAYGSPPNATLGHQVVPKFQY